MKPEPNDFLIINDESARLEMMNLPYLHINVLDRKPVVLVDVPMMERIISIRDSGVQLKGLFVSLDENGNWSASYLDHDGVHHYKTGLTECRAYRFALGYPVGRKTLGSRFSGSKPYKLRSKSRHKCIV